MEPAKKRVRTYLSNLGPTKIDGGEVAGEACRLVDWRGDSREGPGGLGVEGSPVQILEVVATMIRTPSRVHPLDRRR